MRGVRWPRPGSTGISAQALGSRRDRIADGRRGEHSRPRARATRNAASPSELETSISSSFRRARRRTRARLLGGCGSWNEAACRPQWLARLAPHPTSPEAGEGARGFPLPHGGEGQGEGGSSRRSVICSRAVGFVGASGDIAKNSARPLRFLRSRLRGSIVRSTRRPRVLGERAYVSGEALGRSTTPLS